MTGKLVKLDRAFNCACARDLSPLPAQGTCSWIRVLYMVSRQPAAKIFDTGLGVVIIMLHLQCRILIIMNVKQCRASIVPRRHTHQKEGLGTRLVPSMTRSLILMIGRSIELSLLTPTPSFASLASQPRPQRRPSNPNIWAWK